MERHKHSAAARGSPFAERVYAIVRRIPPGRVTTYGRIARAAGAIRSARMVGWLLHHAPPDVAAVAHRVVNRNGELTGGWAWGHPAVMRALLEEEGVTFVEEFRVDLERHLWEPGDDPSEPDSMAELPPQHCNDRGMRPVGRAAGSFPHPPPTK